jgi:hypothetical protein
VLADRVAKARLLLSSLEEGKGKKKAKKSKSKQEEEVLEEEEESEDEESSQDEGDTGGAEITEILDKRVEKKYGKQGMKVEYKVNTRSGEVWIDKSQLMVSQDMLDKFESTKVFNDKCVRDGWFDHDNLGKIVTAVVSHRASKQGAQYKVVYSGKRKGGTDWEATWELLTNLENLTGWARSFRVFENSRKNKDKKKR